MEADDVRLHKDQNVIPFDTGFVTFVKGWESIREDDRGLLWEHLVLDTLRAGTDGRPLYYWRDKSGRELDFIMKGSGKQVDAIECKINPDRFEIDASPFSVRLILKAETML